MALAPFEGSPRELDVIEFRVDDDVIVKRVEEAGQRVAARQLGFAISTKSLAGRGSTSLEEADRVAGGGA